MRLGVLLGAMVLHLTPAAASFERTGDATRTAAVAGAGVSLSGDIWAAILNPACGAALACRTIALSHVPSQFELTELRRSSLVFGEPTPYGSFVVTASTFGFDLYNEVILGILYSHALNKEVRFGIALNHFRLGIKGYGSASAVGIDAGLQWDAADNVQLGFSTSNLNTPTIGDVREKLPQTFSLGLAYHPQESFLVLLDLVKDVRYPLEIRFGVEYVMMDMLSLRGGVGRDPSTYSGGFALDIGTVGIEYAFTRHEELGFTHRFGITVRLGGA